MKFKHILITLILFLPFIIRAQELKLMEVESNYIVNISADQSWEVVQDWVNLNKLVPEVVKSTTLTGHGLNSTWVINLMNGGSITEKMVYYNSSERVMSYIMTETPMPIKNYNAIIKVEPYGISKSLISFYTSCETATENFDNIKGNFKIFQETYLSNINDYE